MMRERRRGGAGLMAAGMISLSLMLSGCANKPLVITHTPEGAHYDHGDSFYVSLPQNGAHGANAYPKSGIETATEYRAALLAHGCRTEIGTVPAESLTVALTEAKKRGLTHVAQATILDWADRATQWTGVPDSLTLHLAIYNTASGVLESSATIEIRGGNGWNQTAAAHPQDMLPWPMQGFVDPLF